METVFDILTRFVREIAHITNETLLLSFSVLSLVLFVLVMYWLYNRKKFRELSHQIPASVLKNYLDSIIQNSTSLKSSLFRGGGLEIGQGIPSVVPVGDLPSSASVSVGGASSEELNQKNAEIASLTQRVSDKDRQLADMEIQLKTASESSNPSDGADQSEEIAILKKEIEDLRAQLAAAPAGESSGGGDDAMKAELETVSKERDELKERLAEYEIIEEDLANLKRLQQENEQLREELAKLKGGAPAEPEPVAEPAADVPETVVESDEDLEAAMAAAIDGGAAEEDETGVPANEGEQKSAEELLSEFEKMLG